MMIISKHGHKPNRIWSSNLRGDCSAGWGGLSAENGWLERLANQRGLQGINDPLAVLADGGDVTADLAEDLNK